MTCSICCDTFNKTMRAQVVCPNSECNLDVCKTCVRTYLLGSIEDPHCMGCRVGFQQNYLLTNLNQTFVKKEFKTWRTQVLLEDAKSKMADTQAMAQDYQEVLRIEKLNAVDKKTLGELMKQAHALRDIMQSRSQQIIRIRSGLHTVADKERKAFVMPCPDEGCKGYLTSGYTCGICNKKTCPKCVIILDGPHECDPDMVATAELIKKETKPCPTCGERIGKVSGCDQMWCIKCHTTFSWNKGAIEKGDIHNPHYYQWLREQSVDGNIPRARGDRRANLDGVTTHALKSLVKDNQISGQQQELVLSSSRYTRHLEAHMRLYNNVPQNDNGTLQNATDDEKARIDYMLNHITENKFCEGLISRDITRKRWIDFSQVYTLYSGSLNSTLEKIHTELLTAWETLPPTRLISLISELSTIHHACILQLMILSHIYHRKVSVNTLGPYLRQQKPIIFSKENIADWEKQDPEIF